MLYFWGSGALFVVRSLIIVGAGGHGKVVADVAQSLRCYEAISFIDGRYPALTAHFGLDVVGSDESISRLISSEAEFVVAIGDNLIRRRLFSRLAEENARFATIIAPSATISPSASVGSGSVVFPKAVVRTGSVIGENVILNTGCKLDPSVYIGHHSHVGPGASLGAGALVEDEVLVGAGARLSSGISVGRRSICGAGVYLESNLPAGWCGVGRENLRLYKIES